MARTKEELKALIEKMTYENTSHALEQEILLEMLESMGGGKELVSMGDAIDAIDWDGVLERFPAAAAKIKSLVKEGKGNSIILVFEAGLRYATPLSVFSNGDRGGLTFYTTEGEEMNSWFWEE